MATAYYDTSYIFKLESGEPGAFEVGAHARGLQRICCSLHGRAEFVSVCHRKIREGSATQAQLKVMMKQVDYETSIGALQWLPITESAIAAIEKVFVNASGKLFLRAADAIHLAVARENGFTEIFSNDRHLLNAAAVFGLKGINILPE